MQASKCFMKIKKQSYLLLYLVSIFGYFQIIQVNDFYTYRQTKTIIYHEKFRTTEERVRRRAAPRCRLDVTPRCSVSLTPLCTVNVTQICRLGATPRWSDNNVTPPRRRTRPSQYSARPRAARSLRIVATLSIHNIHNNS